MKRSQSSNSEPYSHADSPHRFHSPLRSDLGDPPETPPYASPDTSPASSPAKSWSNSKVIVAVDKCTQYSSFPSTLPEDNLKQTENVATVKMPSPVMVANRAVREEPPSAVTKVGDIGDGYGTVRSRAPASGPRRARKVELVGTAAVGLRVCEVILCLISFSVMASDKTEGWSGDSFDRYKEYRYCLSVNVIAFVYSGFQAFDLAYHLTTGRHAIGNHIRYYFDFFMDQVLAYLLISAASSAASRVNDWQSNWGKDEFTRKASASVAIAFLAFIAFGASSIISGYNLCISEWE